VAADHLFNASDCSLQKSNSAKEADTVIAFSCPGKYIVGRAKLNHSWGYCRVKVVLMASIAVHFFHD